MGIRTNTLGKSAIINRQLNGAYDIVEYVADNLPLLISLNQKIDLANNLGSIADHINNDDIHLTEDEKEFLENLIVNGTISETQFENTITNIMDSIDATESVLESTQSTLEAHTTNSAIHYSAEERQRLNDAINTLQSIISKGTLSNVAYSGSYNDLTNKPEIPDLTSLTTEVNKKVNTVSLSKVAFSGKYEDLVTKVPVDSEPRQNSNNPITSNAVYNLTQQMNNLPTPMSQEGIETIMNMKLDNYYTKSEIDEQSKRYLKFFGDDIDGDSSGGSSSTTPSTSVDLSDYYTKSEVDTKFNTLPTSITSTEVNTLISNSLGSYYTKSEVDTKISNIPTTDLSNYYTKEEVEELIANIPVSTETNEIITANNILFSLPTSTSLVEDEEGSVYTLTDQSTLGE